MARILIRLSLCLTLFCLLVGSACTNQARPIPEDPSSTTGGDSASEDASDTSNSVAAGTTSTPKITQMQITVGTTVFHATLEGSATAQSFAAKLPLTLDMRDVNANEKFYELPSSLPTDATNPGTIQSGDLMLYGSNGLVLFYKTFSTSYSYTRIGRIDDASGLEAALGARNAQVTFRTMNGH